MIGMDSQPLFFLADAGGGAFFAWAVKSLGPAGLLIPALGFATFVGACVVVARSRRPAVIAAYLLFVPMPWLLAIFRIVSGTATSFSVIAMSDMTLKPSQIYSGLAETFLVLQVGLMATIPAYLVVAVGLFVCTLRAKNKTDG